MIRTEAYNAVGGMLLTASGVCTGENHKGPKCERRVAVTLVSSELMERFGVGGALVDALEHLMQEYPEMAEMILC